MKAKARYVRRCSQHSSFKQYISSISSYASPKKMRDRMQKFNGNYSAFAVPLFTADGDSSFTAQADVLGLHFQQVSSSSQYTERFLRKKREAEKSIINVSGGSREKYNVPFSFEELMRALYNCKSSAPGPYQIHYFMIRHMHSSTLDLLLILFNRIWLEGFFSAAWTTAIIVPLLKPGKSPNCPTSYRPIALTSCLCKHFDRIIGARLMYVLEHNHILDKFQCGFRVSRFTLDHLVRFETTVREAFVNRQHCLSVFFDIEKAYDTAWRYGIIQDLYNMGIRGFMSFTIRSYLGRCTFRLKLGKVLSRKFVQENGVPQGRVLSVILFIVTMNSLSHFSPPNIQYSLYVDNLQISFSSCNLSICKRRLQVTRNRLQKWSDKNGFRFFTQKTVCVCFSRRRGILPSPSLILNNSLIPVKQEHTFLGIVFDSKLSFGPHTKALKLKYQKSFNILRVLSRKSWGSDRACLFRVYHSAVRSRLDYGSIAYGSAKPQHLKCWTPFITMASA